MAKSQIGLVGLAVMGENLALNIERNGFPITVYNRSGDKTDALLAGRAKGKKFSGAKTVQELVASLDRPRRIILLVKAGAPVDDMVTQLTPLLEPGDIIIDGGNSHFTDTRKRETAARAKGIHFVGSGVSGGEEGALWGPSLMPGGPKEAYEHIRPVWEKIAAKVDDGPCVTYIGPDGAGHFVKMVHNGIEYGDMQLIAESYDVLRQVLGLEAPQLAEIFEEWNKGLLNSFLIEITGKVLRKKDPETGKWLVDLILDKAGQKGTGKWMSQIALDLGVPIPTINAAVEGRILSAFKEDRVNASKVLTGPKREPYKGDPKALIEAVRDALYASKICSYAQGMFMMRVAGDEYKWNLPLGEIARIWKGGCIIRAQFLDLIKSAFQKNPNLPNLLLDDHFKAWVTEAQPRWRHVVATAQSQGIPVLAMSSSLAYYDSVRSERLPLNLTQAQRDFFGAHTYERIDKPGKGPFHTEWGS
ncbi:MAG TPA: NADP-dependent phosphogluconate dehydrogenase [Planctomycetota bacterium]|nr:NADP-dependent phosphogluconate dehydrogenase [Planctomycetota bacterium]